MRGVEGEVEAEEEVETETVMEAEAETETKHTLWQTLHQILGTPWCNSGHWKMQSYPDVLINEVRKRRKKERVVKVRRK